MVTFILLFLGSSVFGKTTTIELFVNGENHPFPTVSITECPHKVKLSIRNNETGEIVEEIVTPQTEEGGVLIVSEQGPNGWPKPNY